MNLRFVEAFVWVARLASFKGAAGKLFTTQAAISSRIATLEDEIGVRLFERDGRSVALTLQGRMLLPVAEQMLGLADQFRGIARPVAKAELEGTLRVGMIDTVAQTWLPALLTAFAAEYPRVGIELHSDITPMLRDELVRGRIDCAVLAEEVVDPHIESRLLDEVPVIWVAAPGTPAAAAPGPLDAVGLAALPIITFHRESSVYRSVLRALGGAPRPRLNCFTAVSSMLAMTRAGFGIAALPEPVVRDALRAGELVEVQTVEPLAPLAIAVSIRSERNSPMLDDFLHMAAEVSAQWQRSTRNS